MADRVFVAGANDITALLPMRECIEVVAQALETLARGQAQVPLRTRVASPSGKGVLLVMPGNLSEPAALGTKLITIFEGNHAVGRDSHQGLVMLFDPEDGRPTAILDAVSITAIRTAAASAVATRLLAREGASDLAILGSGTQARTHLEAMLLVRPIRRVRVYSRTPAHAVAFAHREGERHGITIEVAGSAEEAVRGADLICAVTTATAPVLLGRWLAPGAHINAVGAASPPFRELDEEAIARSVVFADQKESVLHEAPDFQAALQAGCIQEAHIRGNIGDLLTQRLTGRSSPDDITLFKSQGLAVEDLAAAQHVLAKARAENRGGWLELG